MPLTVTNESEIYKVSWISTVYVSADSVQHIPLSLLQNLKQIYQEKLELNKKNMQCFPHKDSVTGQDGVFLFLISAFCFIHHLF